MRGDLMYGCGTSDMKSGVALALHLAVTLPDPRYDVTYLFYEAEEIESRVQRAQPGRPGAPGVAARPTSRCCWSRRTASSRRAARAPCGRWSPRPAYAGPLGALLARGERDPRRRRGAAAAPDVRGAAGHHRRLRLPRGPERGAASTAGSPATWSPTAARSRSTTGSPRTAPRPRREAHLREVFAGFEVTVTDAAPAPLPGLDAARGAGVPGGGRRRADRQAGLDRRGPVRGAWASRR